MRPKLFILCLFVSSISISQQSYTHDQLLRLADAGKVWGYIKYYHPYLQYKNINWDSAFVACVPKIIEAKNKKEYEQSLQELFSILNDPGTGVINIPKPTNPITYSDLVIADSILIITRDDYRAIVDEDTTHKLFEKAIKQFKNAKAVIFDLRPNKETTLLNEVPLQEIFDDTYILANLTTGFLTPPGIRPVHHKAFIGEHPKADGDYQSHFLIERKHLVAGTGDRNIPVIFIVNKYSELPIEAIALQLTGQAVIIQEEGAGEIGIAPDVKFWITDSVLLRVRTGEIINSDNGLGFHPDITIEQSEDRSIAVAKAKEILRSGTKPINNISVELGGFDSKYTGQKISKEIYPPIGSRVLSAAKIYTVIKYFYPNKHLWTHNWDSVYLRFLPRFILAKDSVEYLKAVMEMYPNIEDGHGFIAHPYVDYIRNGPPGTFPPFQTRIIENQLVVTKIIRDSIARVLNIKPGDIILEKNGKNVIQELNERRKYFSASNYDAGSGYIVGAYFRSPFGSIIKLKIKNAEGKIRNVEVPFPRPTDLERQKLRNILDRGGNEPILQFIKQDIGYVNMGGLSTTQVDSMFNLFRNTKAIIFDFRYHPHEAARLIAPRLSEKNPFDETTDYPGEPLRSKENERRGWIYKGKAICLMYENTQSHAEASVSWLKEAGAILVGNHTAGANGNTYHFFIPGGIRLSFSAYNTPMQGKGIQPDILITPTIRGIQQGKDEILERAIKYIETGK
jgi:C-terminal processing protease CtpA/Prc